MCMFFSVQLYVYLYSDWLDVCICTYIHPLVYILDSSHEVLEIVDCCNVVVVHFNVNIWVDPPGREDRWREERWREERRREERSREERWREEWWREEWWREERWREERWRKERRKVEMRREERRKVERREERSRELME